MPAKTSSKSKSTKPTKSKSAKAISADEIAVNAYHLWRTRGGDSMQNWLDAEKQLRASQVKN